MRGKVREMKTGKTRRGITPAYAGKSPEEPREERTAQDHPRVCGEKQGLRAAAAKLLGSPPRMRGKVKSPWTELPPPGITPAYAGKSRLCARGLPRARDHPRVCGEKTKKIP